MPSIYQATSEIHQAFNAVWLPNFPTYPVAWENLPFTPPATTTPWARFTVQHHHGTQPTLADNQSNKRFRRFGTVWLQLFTPTGVGFKSGAGILDIAKRAFEGKSTPGGVVFYEPSVRAGSQDGVWWMVPFTSKFYYDEVVPPT